MDIKIANGDIVLSYRQDNALYSDIQIVTFADLIAQEIMHYLATKPGDIIHEQSFGFNSSFITNAIAVSNPENIAEYLQQYLRQYMSQYIPGMQDVNVSIKIENSTLTITFASKTENKLLATKQIDLTLERS